MPVTALVQSMPYLPTFHISLFLRTLCHPANVLCKRGPVQRCLQSHYDFVAWHLASDWLRAPANFDLHGALEIPILDANGNATYHIKVLQLVCRLKIK